MICDTEILHHTLEEELSPLLEGHWREIARNKDINVLAPDYSRYYMLQGSDQLRIYTLRDENLILCGYNVYILSYNMHYPSSLQAVNDVIYVHPEHRGLGSIRLLQYTERMLREDGVDIMHMHMKVEHDHPALFTRLGYTHAENVYEKRLRG